MLVTYWSSSNTTGRPANSNRNPVKNDFIENASLARLIPREGAALRCGPFLSFIDGSCCNFVIKVRVDVER